MRSIIRFIKVLLVAVPIIFFLAEIANSQNNPSSCSLTKYHGEGYYTTISSVVANTDNSYTIVLTIEHDGCAGPDCRSLSHYSVEALPDTYSDVQVEVLQGSMTYGNIILGPNLGGDPFQGFKVDPISGIGNGLAGVFTITYTLSGGLQDQQVLTKVGNNNNMIVSFTQQEFQSVLSCLNSNIIPYYPPPDGGKLYNSVISAELYSLYLTYLAYDSLVSNDIFQIVEDTSVMIEIVAQDAASYASLLTLLPGPEYGMTGMVGDPVEFRITGVYPAINLLKLNDLPHLVSFAQPVYPGIPQLGLVDTEGDSVMRSYVARNGFNLSGDGIMIGVLSDSYNTRPGNQAADDIDRKDLPGPGNPDYPTPVQFVEDFPYGVASDEGRAMMQIIHDIAPGAQLAFHTGMLGQVDFAQGILDLEAEGCDVIVNDVTYISEPFYRDGIVAQTVNAVVSSGVTYVSSAGNFGNNSYESDFYAGDIPEGLSGPAHNFAGPGGNDIYLNVAVDSGSYTVVLQWDDGSGLPVTSVDMDIYLADPYENVLFGFNRENIGGEAIEVLPFTALDSVETNILIVNAAGAAPLSIKFIVFRGDMVFNEYNLAGASTIFGQANAEGAITVGAAYYENTPAFGEPRSELNYYSSVGGTPTHNIVRDKPDITGPDGVNTMVNLGGPDLDGDNFYNFFGTSAAAPHAAAVAALLLDAKEKFYGSGMTLMPWEVKNILMSTAEDMETTGYDLGSGAGMIQADSALLTLANPSPFIHTITYDTTLVPGEDTIPISIIGQYLTGVSEIYFNGTVLDSATFMNGDTISGFIPAFDERYPAIQVYNPPKPGTLGNDGGLSNSMYFTTKPTIVIDIEDTTKKYGEVMPQFSADYYIETIDGIMTLEEAGLNDSEINRIKAIPLYTVANDTSNAGLWAIVPFDGDPLSPTSSLPVTNPLDTTILYHYNIDYERGLLNIMKMDLLVIPRDTIITYGDSINVLEYLYIYNDDVNNPDNNVVIADPVNEAIFNAIKQTHATALVNAVGVVKATALVNTSGQPLLDSAVLANTSFFISNAASVRNATALVNGELLDPQQILNAVSSASATALVNKLAYVKATALVNGLAHVFLTGSASATALVNVFGGQLVNGAYGSGSATALVNNETITESSNAYAIVILDSLDVLILSSDTVPGTVEISSISIITENEVGIHSIVPGAFVLDNFNISYGLGNITILPDTAYVSVNSEVIYAGDTLPAFAATISGLNDNDDSTVVTNLTFIIDPPYSGDAGVYDIIPVASADNYVFVADTGKLYVNPFGAGTKHIKTQLDCVEELTVPDSMGFSYIAHFSYENNNATIVYIPVGEDNFFTAEGSYFTNSQPVEFIPGGGNFAASFDGNKLTWTVASFKHNGHKTSTASQASSTSSKCKKSEEIDEDTQEGVSIFETKVYPNPTGDILFIDHSSENGSNPDIQVWDIFGRIYDLDVEQISSVKLRVNMKTTPEGVYFIRIKTLNGYEIFRVLKL